MVRLAQPRVDPSLASNSRADVTKSAACLVRFFSILIASFVSFFVFAESNACDIFNGLCVMVFIGKEKRGGYLILMHSCEPKRVKVVPPTADEINTFDGYVRSL